MRAYSDGGDRSSRKRAPPHGLERFEQLIDLRRTEQRIWPMRREISERGLVQTRRLHHSMLGQVIHHEVHELDLVRVFPAPVAITNSALRS